MNLNTTYLGLDLKNPLIASSSSLTGELAQLQAIEKAGAGALVVKSIFEEQISLASEHQLLQNEEYYWFREAADMVDQMQKERGVEQHTQLIKEACSSLEIPVIASINCVSRGNWVSYAKELEEAGAAALELNMGIFPKDQHQTAEDIESTYVELVKSVAGQVRIPVAIKLGHYFTNPLNVGRKIKDAGASGVVLFNRFYQTDIDIQEMKLMNTNWFSKSSEITQSLRWVALFQREEIGLDVAAATGVHNSSGLIKQLLAGANGVQVASVLYQKGLESITQMLKGLSDWMADKKYDRIEEFRGAILNDPMNKTAFERLQFMQRNFES
jgi:dihydroorotate dehydrogenase (fumarate)